MEHRQLGEDKIDALTELGAENAIIIETAYATPIVEESEAKVKEVESMVTSFYSGC